MKKKINGGTRTIFRGGLNKVFSFTFPEGYAERPKSIEVCGSQRSKRQNNVIATAKNENM